LTRLIAASDADFTGLIDNLLSGGSQVSGFSVANGGIETAEVLLMLQGLANNVRQDFSPAAWLILENDHIVGMCSLISAPDADGAIAVGYGIAAGYRGKGICKRAIAKLAEWARSHPQISAITAETALTNGPSQGVLLQNGFEKCGERHDPEDGALFCWRLDTHR
jgi:RimJ/RimL family protein N-acetyltransferase